MSCIKTQLWCPNFFEEELATWSNVFLVAPCFYPCKWLLPTDFSCVPQWWVSIWFLKALLFSETFGMNFFAVALERFLKMLFFHFFSIFRKVATGSSQQKANLISLCFPISSLSFHRHFSLFFSVKKGKQRLQGTTQKMKQKNGVVNNSVLKRNLGKKEKGIVSKWVARKDCLEFVSFFLVIRVISKNFQEIDYFWQ